MNDKLKKDLEAAAKDIYKNNYPGVKSVFLAGAGWMYEYLQKQYKKAGTGVWIDGGDVHAIFGTTQKYGEDKT
jgi:hypothetical protein